MIHGKPIIVNEIINGESNGFIYNDESTNSKKYLLHDSNPVYRMLKDVNKEDILIKINDSNRLERIFGIGLHFKLKDDPHVYTFVDNSYGLTGSGYSVDVNHLLIEETAVSDMVYLEQCKDFDANTYCQILNNFAYETEFGRTFYLTSNKKQIYASGYVNKQKTNTPVLIIEPNGIIDKVFELKGSNLIILLTNGNLFYWGVDNSCYLTSPSDMDYENGKMISLSTAIEGLWAMYSCIVYKKNNKLFYAGFCDDEISTYPFSIDTHIGEKCPFPGIELFHYPFKDIEDIKQMMFMKHGIAVLNNDGELNITGKDWRNNIEDSKVILQDVNVEQILYTNGNIVGYKLKNENKIRLSDGRTVTDYIMRKHKYLPSIALL